MDTASILRKTDHTILAVAANQNDVRTVCVEAEKFCTASACIPPCFVKQMHKEFPKLTICTVIGFPNGYSSTSTKAFEAFDALNNGANELDLVANIADIKSKAFDNVFAEIRAIKKVCAKHTLKVIVETCLLTEEEKIRMCQIVTDAKADFIKTSTGFSSAGAQIADIALFRKHLGGNVKIKASGGIKTLEQAAVFLEAGCERIGASALVRCAIEES